MAEPQVSAYAAHHRPFGTYRFTEARAVRDAERRIEGDQALSEIYERERALRSNMERLRAARLAKEKG